MDKSTQVLAAAIKRLTENAQFAKNMSCTDMESHAAQCAIDTLFALAHKYARFANNVDKAEFLKLCEIEQ